MADSFRQFEVLVKEQLDDAVVNLQLPDDDIAWQLLGTFKATNQAGADRFNAPGSRDSDWFADYVINLQRGGTIEADGFGGTTLVQAGKYSHLNVGQTISSLYPDPEMAAMRSDITVRMVLKRLKGLIPGNKDQIIAKMVSTPVDEVASNAVEDAVALIRGLATSYFYGDGGGALARVDLAAGYTVGEGDSRVAVSIKEGTPFRFIRGQKYVAASYVAPGSFGSSTRTARAGSANSPGIMVCVDIDTKNRQPVLQSWPGEGNISLTDGDVLMLYNTFNFSATTVDAGSLVPQGAEGLLKESGTFPGAIHGSNNVDVSEERALSSFVQGSDSALEPPTPEIIAEMTDYVTDQGFAAPSALIGEQSVWTLYAQLEREHGVQYTVPQGAAFTASGGVGGINLGHFGMSFARLPSNKARPGSILAISQDTWRRFLPMGGMNVNWYFSGGGVSGMDSIYGPTPSGRQWSELFQAPFDTWYQIGCDNPRRNYRRIGLYSQRTYQ